MIGCPDCVPGAKAPEFTQEQYQHALDALAARIDMTPDQRQRATDYLESHKPRAQEGNSE